MCNLCKENVCNLVKLVEFAQEFNSLEENTSDEWIVYDKEGREIKL
jgi:hypothetical protein